MDKYQFLGSHLPDVSCEYQLDFYIYIYIYIYIYMKSVIYSY